MIESAVFERVESLETAAELGSLGSRKAFMAGVVRLTATRELIRLASEDPDGPQQIAVRLRRLVDTDVDPQYQHPYDVAVAVYLRTLDIVAHRHAEVISPAVAKAANLWWAKPLAVQLAKNTRIRSAAAESTARRHFKSLVGVLADTATPGSSSAATFGVFAGAPPVIEASTGAARALNVGSTYRFDVGTPAAVLCNALGAETVEGSLAG